MSRCPDISLDVSVPIIDPFFISSFRETQNCVSAALCIPSNPGLPVTCFLNRKFISRTWFEDTEGIKSFRDASTNGKLTGIRIPNAKKTILK